MPFASPMLRLTPSQYQRIVAHCLDAERDPSSGLMFEACGLLAGAVHDDREPTGKVTEVYPCGNEERSAKIYRIDGRDYLHASRDAEAHGTELIGVWHSHTHSPAFPSQTDIEQAPDPAWIYAIVSLMPGVEPVVRAYRLRDGEVSEVQVVLDGA
jgi:proteasome lid subunit RPN8/RPN11